MCGGDAPDWVWERNVRIQASKPDAWAGTETLAQKLSAQSPTAQKNKALADKLKKEQEKTRALQSKLDKETHRHAPSKSGPEPPKLADLQAAKVQLEKLGLSTADVETKIQEAKAAAPPTVGQARVQVARLEKRLEQACEHKDKQKELLEQAASRVTEAADELAAAREVHRMAVAAEADSAGIGHKGPGPQPGAAPKLSLKQVLAGDVSGLEFDAEECFRVEGYDLSEEEIREVKAREEEIQKLVLGAAQQAFSGALADVQRIKKAQEEFQERKRAQKRQRTTGTGEDATPPPATPVQQEARKPGTIPEAANGAGVPVVPPSASASSAQPKGSSAAAQAELAAAELRAQQRAATVKPTGGKEPHK